MMLKLTKALPLCSVVFLIACSRVDQTATSTTLASTKGEITDTVEADVTTTQSILSTATLPVDLSPLPTHNTCYDGEVLFKASHFSNSDEELSHWVTCSNGMNLQEISGDMFPPSRSEGAQNDKNLALVVGSSILVTDLNGNLTATFFQDSSRAISFPTWSPSGEYLAMLRESELGSNLEIIHLKSQSISSDVVSVPEDPFISRWEYVEWSPVDNKLLLKIGSQIYIGEVICDVEHICSGEIVARATKSANRTSPRWSPDGSRFIYQCYTTPTEDDDLQEAVCVENIFNSDLKEYSLTELGIQFIDQFEWSPDGNKVALVALPLNESSTHVYILALTDGSIFDLSSSLNSSESQYEVFWRPQE